MKLSPLERKANDFLAERGVIIGTGTSLSTDVSQWYYNGIYLNSTGSDCLDLENATEVTK